MLPPELQPTPLEIACGIVYGWAPPPPLPAVPRELTPLAALEESLVPALERGRCHVAFSGGRDSSSMLAVAVRAARRRGLGDPIPVTLRFPHAEGTDETEWQEEVIGHLGVADWERIELTDELDVLGEAARTDLLHLRCPWPANGHSFAPLYAAARGGTLVTGMDGDGLLGAWQWRHAAAVVSLRRRPAPRDALRLARAYGPRTLRRAVVTRRGRPFSELGWLTDAARRELMAGWASYLAGEPARWDRRLQRWYLGQRHLAVLRALMAAKGRRHDVEVVHPLLDARFLAAFARAGGRSGYADRTAAVRALVGGLLPERVVTRRTKGVFRWAFWGPQVQAFAERWDGRGVDPKLVDPVALREAWLSEEPDFRALSLLQQAWLDTAGER